MAKNYQVSFRIGANVHSSYNKAFTRANKGLKSMNKNLKGITKASNKAKTGANLLSSTLKKLGVAAGAYAVYNKAKQFLSESTEAAKAQIEVEKKLAAVMKNTKGVTESQINNIKKYASQLQNTGIIGDEVTIAGTQQLATYQLQSKSLKTLMPGMLDLVAQQKGLNATQQDAVNIGNMLGKVMSGQTGALSRAGINFTKAQEKVLKFGTEEEKAAMLAKVLKQNVGGVNKALTETDQGQIQQTNNLWGDMKEEIGKKILPLQARFAKWFMNKIPKIQKILTKTIDIITAGIDKISAVFTTVKKYIDKIKPNFKKVTETIGTSFKTVKNDIGKTFSPEIINKSKEWATKVKENFKFLGNSFKPIGKSLFENLKPLFENTKTFSLNLSIKGIEVFQKTIDTALKIFDKIKPIITDFQTFLTEKFIPKVSKGFLKIQKNVYPIIEDIVNFIVDNIVPIFNQLAENVIPRIVNICNNLGQIFATNFAHLVNFVAWLTGVLKPVWDALWPHVSKILKDAFSSIKDIISAIFRILDGLITFVTGIFTGNWQKAWQGVKDVFGGVWDGLIGLIKTPLNSIIRMFNSVSEKINSINIEIPKWVPGLGGKNLGFTIPKFPELATGAIATGPTLAWIGEGREDEALLPLSKLESMLDTPKQTNNSNSQPIQINYSPQIIVGSNNVQKEEIQEAQREGFNDFKSKMEEFFYQNKRLSLNYAGE